MNIEIWCKSFLSIYNIIPNIIKSIDKLVYLKSVSSSGITINSTLNTFNQIDKIVTLTQKKVNLINLKILCDEIMLEMNKYNSKLILLRYIDGLSCEKIMQLLGLTRRTYFRKLANALKDFQFRLYNKIMKNKILYNNFVSEDFFDEIFEKINDFENKLYFSSKENIDISKYSNSLCKIILKQMKKAF